MPRHLIAGDPRAVMGGCSNHGPGLRVRRSASVHFPHCDPGDCYCGVYWGEDCDRHEFMALGSGIVVCGRCKQLPDRELTHGQLKHARDLARAEWKRVVAARYSDAALAWMDRLVRLNHDIDAAATPAAKDAARERLRRTVEHHYRDR